jgi:hypothetical protein
VCGCAELAYAVPELKVKFTTVDLSGATRTQYEDDAAGFLQIALSSVPHLSDRSCPADPAAPWLEMFANPFNKAKPVKAGKNALVTDSQSSALHLYACLC